MSNLIASEGLGLGAVSEENTNRSKGGVPNEKIVFHGNNKLTKKLNLQSKIILK